MEKKIYSSDIVFNPVVESDPEKEKERIKNINLAIEEESPFFNDEDNFSIDSHFKIDKKEG